MFSNLSDSSAIRFDFPQMKAYPSVYSANNGNMHTEETVRWLTKKISSKSFIAATDKDKFYIDCDALAEYASEGRGIGISPVSMSIDGYQIKKGSPSEVSFDVYDNEPMILNISKQCDFVNELVNQSTAISTDINNIVYNAYKTTTANYLQNWYSLENSDEDIVIGRVKVTYNDQTFLNQLTYNSGTPGYIFYDSNDKIIAYTSEESAPISDETTIPFAVVTGSPITSVDLYYPVLYSKKRYLSNNKTKLNSYPIIKFTDIFGFDFIRTVSVGMTKTYPSAHSFTDYETNCAGSIPLLSDYIPQVSAYISSLNDFSNGLT